MLSGLLGEGLGVGMVCVMLELLVAERDVYRVVLTGRVKYLVVAEHTLHHHWMGAIAVEVESNRPLSLPPEPGQCHRSS